MSATGDSHLELGLAVHVVDAARVAAAGTQLVHAPVDAHHLEAHLHVHTPAFFPVAAQDRPRRNALGELLSLLLPRKDYGDRQPAFTCRQGKNHETISSPPIAPPRERMRCPQFSWALAAHVRLKFNDTATAVVNVMHLL